MFLNCSLIFFDVVTVKKTTFFPLFYWVSPCTAVVLNFLVMYLQIVTYSFYKSNIIDNLELFTTGWTIFGGDNDTIPSLNGYTS